MANLQQQQHHSQSLAEALNALTFASPININEIMTKSIDSSTLALTAQRMLSLNGNYSNNNDGKSSSLCSSSGIGSAGSSTRTSTSNHKQQQQQQTPMTALEHSDGSEYSNDNSGNEWLLVDQKKSNINCLLCKGRLREPKILNCLHVFCKPCLTEQIKCSGNRSTSSICCIKCEQETEVRYLYSLRTRYFQVVSIYRARNAKLPQYTQIVLILIFIFEFSLAENPVNN